MAAVFIPVSFMSGPTGVFYRQFSLTMAISIVLSGVVALTLTPALCATMLKRHHHDPNAKRNRLQRFFGGFNTWYEGLSGKYKRLIEIIANRRVVTWVTIIGFT